jgi:hypothetical protein
MVLTGCLISPRSLGELGETIAKLHLSSFSSPGGNNIGVGNYQDTRFSFGPTVHKIVGEPQKANSLGFEPDIE